MRGFSHVELEIETPATGYLTVEIGFTCDFSRDDPPELRKIDEISVEGGPWLSLAQLQAFGERTLAVEVVSAVEDYIHDCSGDLWDLLLEDEHERAIDERDEYRYNSRRDY